MPKADRVHSTPLTNTAVISSPDSSKQETAPALSKEDDEVVALGVRLGAVMRREDGLMARAGAAKRSSMISAEIYLDKATEHAADEVYVLRDTLSLVRAKSPEGAAIQIVEALILVDRIWDQFPEDHETPQLRRDARSIGRLLYSALGVVESLADRKIEDVVSPDFVSRHCDPWIPVEDQCPDLRGGEA